jgi:hypothetical protein
MALAAATYLVVAWYLVLAPGDRETWQRRIPLLGLSPTRLVFSRASHAMSGEEQNLPAAVNSELGDAS